MSRRVQDWLVNEIPPSDRTDVDADDLALDGSGTAVQRLARLETQVRKISRAVRMMMNSLSISE